ncbi:MAG: hypothetical protein IMZ56_01680 [Candidatus Atribacteria bacterium]|nr:hypothetical protein [Candidatus Atribacteria bacterium]
MINNAAEKNQTGTAWVKVKTIQLMTQIVGSSKFRFLFSLNAADGGNGYGQIYRNGVAVGTEQTVVGGAGYDIKTEDINTTNWIAGDYLDLWTRMDTAFGRRIFCKDFKICATGSEFANTLGM